MLTPALMNPVRGNPCSGSARTDPPATSKPTRGPRNRSAATLPPAADPHPRLARATAVTVRSRGPRCVLTPAVKSEYHAPRSRVDSTLPVRRTSVQFCHARIRRCGPAAPATPVSHPAEGPPPSASPHPAPRRESSATRVSAPVRSPPVTDDAADASSPLIRHRSAMAPLVYVKLVLPSKAHTE